MTEDSSQPSTHTDDGSGVELPDGVSGWAKPELEHVVRKFGRIFSGHDGGGALCVYSDGERVLDIWAGDARRGLPWTGITAPVIFSASKCFTATVIHRLVDRGLIEYDQPVSRYWAEFGAAGKQNITVREVMDHKAGLSRLTGIANNADELLDHELMERRLAAAPVGRYYGKPAYHATSFGWLLAGLARSVTGADMRTLYRTELADPLGEDGIHLGRPPSESPTVPAAMYEGLDKALAAPALGRILPLAIAVFNSIPGIKGAASTMYVPGVETLFADDGTANARLLDSQIGAGNAMCTASAFAKMFAALAGDGTVDGRTLLSKETVAGLARGYKIRPDHTMVMPFGVHLGYQTVPWPRYGGGFGHWGTGGSMGWADQRRRLAVGLVHNRVLVRNPLHQVAFNRLWPSIIRATK